MGRKERKSRHTIGVRKIVTTIRWDVRRRGSLNEDIVEDRDRRFQERTKSRAIAMAA